MKELLIGGESLITGQVTFMEISMDNKVKYKNTELI
jgi:hypothetical protein